MPFEEFTAQLPLRKSGNTMEFNIDIDVDTRGVVDIYTERSNYEKLPAPLKKLEWSPKLNALFIHLADHHIKTAWTYLAKHAILDTDLERLLA